MPGPPTNLAIVNDSVDTSAFTVSFVGPSYSNCTIDYYVVEWQPMQSGAASGRAVIRPFVPDAYMQVEDRLLGVPKLPHILRVDRAVSPGTKYRIAVYGVSSAGNGTRSTITVVTAPAPTAAPSYAGADLQIGLGLGLGLGVLLLLILVRQPCRQRIRFTQTGGGAARPPHGPRQTCQPNRLHCAAGGQVGGGPGLRQAARGDRQRPVWSVI